MPGIIMLKNLPQNAHLLNVNLHKRIHNKNVKEFVTFGEYI